ncbi:periplasmic heavy metal sensor [Labilibacter sediminis]|nr:periplasmic heavy metal sensor [Labilibacter sediminis]
MNANKVFRLVAAAGLVVVLIIGTSSGFRSEDKPKEGCKIERRGPGAMGLMDLTDAQKEQMKSLKLRFIKEITPIKNELGVKSASLKAVSTGDNVDSKKVYKLLEEIGSLKVEMSKKHFDHKQSVRELLTEEQRVLFDAHSGKRHEMGKRKGMKPHGERGNMKQKHNKRRAYHHSVDAE